MSLARVKVWVNGEILTGPDLNTEIDNIINNPVSLLFPSTATMDFGQQSVNNLVIGTNNTSTNLGGLNVIGGFPLLILNDGTAAPKILGPHSGLSRVRGLQGSLISNIGSFAAAGYQMERSVTGGAVGNNALMNISATSSFSINTQMVGPNLNGRDQAAAFASTDIHFYAISPNLGSTLVFGVCSSTPPPVGPATVPGYSYWVYLCSAKYSTGSSSVAWPWRVAGSRLSSPQSALGPGLPITSTEAVVDLKSYIPALATCMHVQNSYTLTATVGGSKVAVLLRVGVESSPAASDYDLRYDISGLTTVSGTLVGLVPSDLPVLASGPIIYGTSTASVGLSASNVPSVQGYSVPNGDN